LIALTIIDEATNWVEFALVKDIDSKQASSALDKTWFCRYPRPTEFTFDNGAEFIGQEFQELLHSYGITPKPTTAKNPQANGIIERVHLTMTNISTYRVS